ncbi:hypothetical protein EW093_01350 [Thiospirochaeta perfilievii]|uniref:7TM-DISM receptor extracellular domain-containing protein n=1 Tax=Thiospirochaeta perfilievii TaxID=252967 RepID=A0A5C1QB67_9SPIO|nr:7TM diverse intracellular signaling domain-containing protein [Thiospirochaeta perfilievii]QEN03402.1 hypothetical protein EW093_01350 [Thiospirochaeta perfilievii]
MLELKNSKYKTVIYTTLILLLIILMSIPEIYKIDTIDVNKGQSSWDKLYSGKVLSLKGDWQFFDSKGKEYLLKVPGIWNSIYSDGSGRGKYVCNLFFTEENCPKYIEIMATSAGTSYILTVNNVRLGASWDEYFGVLPKENAHKTIFTFAPTPGRNIIEYDVENSTHPKGGLWERVLISDTGKIKTNLSRSRSIELLMFGSLIFLGFFQFLLFFMKSANWRTYLFFGFCTIFMAFGNIVRSYFSIYEIWPSAPYLLVKKLQFIAYYLACIFFIWKTDLGRNKYLILVYWILTAFLVLHSLLFIILPFSASYYLSFYPYIIMMLFVLYLIFDSINKLFQGDKQEIIHMIGLSFLLFGNIKDCVDMILSRYDWQIMPYTNWIYCLFATFFLAADFGRSSKEAKEAQKTILTLSEEERNEIGRELHDGVGQLTFGLEYLSNGHIKQNKCDLEVLRKINETSKDINKRIRLLIHEYYPEKEGFLLNSALKELVTRFKAIYNKSIVLIIDPEFPILKREDEVHVYYIISEAMKNALIHSNNGDIEISLKKDKNLLYVTITNSFTEDNDFKIIPGHGMKIMKYRATTLNGTLKIEKKIKSYTVSLSWKDKTK